MKTLRLSPLFLMMSTALAYAEESAIIGIGVSAEKTPYKRTGTQYRANPTVMIEARHFYVDGLEAGIYAINNDTHQLALTVSGGHQFDPDDSDDAQIKALKKRKTAIMAGLDYSFTGRYGQVGASVNKDLSGHSKGINADLAYGALVKTGRVTVVPSLGLAYYDRKWNNYYYGVSAEEQQHTQLAPYQANKSVHPYVNLTVLYALAPKWQTYIDLQYEHIGKEVKHSPMVDQRYRAQLSTGLLYTF